MAEHAYEIPASRLDRTHWNPAVSSGPSAVMDIVGKRLAPQNWVEDLQQVTSGAGSVAFTRRTSEADQHPCPNCRSTTSRKLDHVPNCAHWGVDHSCECGLDYAHDDIGMDDPAWLPEGVGSFVEHRRGLGLRVDLEQGRADFEHWWERSAPAGSEPVYDEGAYSLLGVRLPDGREVMR